MQEISRVVAIGPESTGKSSLCQSLATHFNAVWCPEFAREYLLNFGTEYTFDDLLSIAKGQVALEEECAVKAIEQWEEAGKKTLNPLMFIDTDMYVMKVWCEYVFGKCHPFILEQIAKSDRHLYLLCNIDLPWVKDELREYPDSQKREELYNIYKDILMHQNVPWVYVQGRYEERVETAIQAIKASFIYCMPES